MKKKILSVLAVLLPVGLVGCNVNIHEHTFKGEWASDSVSHWHEASCEHTELISDKANHVDADKNNKCDVCGADIPVTSTPHEHSFKAEWSKDEVNHWHAADCEHTELTKDLAAHSDSDNNGKCDTCGYTIPVIPAPHEHSFKAEWTSDEVNHWHAADCEHTELTKDLAAHSDLDNNGKCDTCGYTIPVVPAPHEHTYDLEHWSQTSTHHWHESNCEHSGLAIDVGEHTYDGNGVCTVCDYEKEAVIFSFDFKSDYCDLNYEENYKEGDELNLSLTLKQEFESSKTLPEEIEVYSDGVLLTSGTDYTYSIIGDVGKIIMTVKGNIVVKVFENDDQSIFKVNEEQFNDAINSSKFEYIQYELNSSLYTQSFILINAFEIEYSPMVVYQGTYSLDSSSHSSNFYSKYSYIEKVNDEYTEYRLYNSEDWEREVTDETQFNYNKHIDLTYLPMVPKSDFTFNYDAIKNNFNEITNAYEVEFVSGNYVGKFEVTFYDGLIKTVKCEGSNEYGGGFLTNINVKYAHKEVTVPDEARLRTYTVIWKNYDGEILEIDYEVEEGTMPSCDVTPVKEDERYLFNFTGWDKKLTPVTENIVYTAQFERDLNKHIVIFEDNLGNELNRQFVTTGEEPDLTLFNYKWFTDAEKAHIFTGWEEPIGYIYGETTIVGNYEVYDKQIPYADINAMISPEALGDNFAYDVGWTSNGIHMRTEHVSVANGKYKNIWEYGADNPSYGGVVENYYDSGYSYSYLGNDGARIRHHEAENPLFKSEITYDLSAFVAKVDADYIFDETIGMFVSSGSYERVTMTLKDGMVDWMKREMNSDLKASDPATSFDTLQIINIGGVEPFDIPDYDYEGLEKYHITFTDVNSTILGEQDLYEGMMPKAPTYSQDIVVTEDKVYKDKLWDKEFVGASEDCTYSLQYCEYKKTYTASEINEMISLSKFEDNSAFDYSWDTPEGYIWTQHVAVADGKLKNIYELYETSPEYGRTIEDYEDYDYKYYYNVDPNQDVGNYCFKDNKPDGRKGLEDTLNGLLRNFISTADYVYNEETGEYVSETDSSIFYLGFKDGKIDYVKRELKLDSGYFDVLDNISFGNTNSFDIPDYGWGEGFSY